MSEPKKTLTVDQIDHILSDIAEHGEGTERLRALLMLRAQENTSVTLPEPMTDHDVISRLGRIMRAAGPTASQLAYRHAFPAAKKDIHKGNAKVTEADISPTARKDLPINLRALYRMFPEIRKPGVPKGYPINRGLLAQKVWCQDMAMRIIIDREQTKAVREGD